MSKEGSTEAPIRHPIDFKHPDFLNPEKLDSEMRRVFDICLLYTSPSPRDATLSRMPSSA